MNINVLIIVIKSINKENILNAISNLFFPKCIKISETGKRIFDEDGFGGKNKDSNVMLNCFL